AMDAKKFDRKILLLGALGVLAVDLLWRPVIWPEAARRAILAGRRFPLTKPGYLESLASSAAMGKGAALERRRRRSDDTMTALHYQLASTRSEGHLDAVVLVDDTGCLVAGAGAWPMCEELAAYAPLLANPAEIGNPVVGSRIARLRPHVDVMRVDVDG